ncbi:hypothetical protein ACNKHP_11710 [Shigella boydii]
MKAYPVATIFIKYEQAEKDSNFVVFLLLNHYALMPRYCMMPKKNQRYANRQHGLSGTLQLFLAEPASNIETIENNVKHTAPNRPKPAKE